MLVQTQETSCGSDDMRHGDDRYSQLGAVAQGQEWGQQAADTKAADGRDPTSEHRDQKHKNGEDHARTGFN